MRVQMEKKKNCPIIKIGWPQEPREEVLATPVEVLGTPMVSQIMRSFTVMRNTPPNRIWDNTEYGARQSDILDIVH